MERKHMNMVKKVLAPLRILKQKGVYRMENRPGISVGKRKILVIESDDWGSIRVPSKMVHDKLNKSGAALDSDPFTKYDGLERKEDLERLFSVLSRYRDCNGNHPVITPFYVMRNANFSKIIDSGYNTFSDEIFLNTYEKYGENSKSVLDIIRQGIEEHIFFPELHCLEHLNVHDWMIDLQRNREDTRLACRNGMYGLGTNFNERNLYGYMDAFHNRCGEQVQEYRKLIETAVSDFESLMGYVPEAFTAPCYIWDPAFENILYENGLKYICGANYQLVPSEPTYDSFKRVNHYVGQRNLNGQLYLNRNVDLELMYGWEETPSIALRQIEAAFSQNKPAVISIHRVNFSTRVSRNSDVWIRQFEEVIQKCIKKWPTIEFMTSRDLGKVYDKMMNRQNEDE